MFIANWLSQVTYYPGKIVIRRTFFYFYKQGRDLNFRELIPASCGSFFLRNSGFRFYFQGGLSYNQFRTEGNGVGVLKNFSQQSIEVMDDAFHRYFPHFKAGVVDGT